MPTITPLVLETTGRQTHRLPTKGGSVMKETGITQQKKEVMEELSHLSLRRLPVPLKQPDSCNRRDGICWIQVSFSLYPQALFWDYSGSPDCFALCLHRHVNYYNCLLISGLCICNMELSQSTYQGSQVSVTLWSLEGIVRKKHYIRPKDQRDVGESDHRPAQNKTE